MLRFYRCLIQSLHLIPQRNVHLELLGLLLKLLVLLLDQVPSLIEMTSVMYVRTLDQHEAH